MADKISWISADGSEYPISDNHLIMAGSDGRFMPPIDFVEENVPFQHGSLLRGVLVRPREIDIPIYVDGNSEVDLRNQLRHLLRVLNPLKGDGKLRITSPDGSMREIICRYKGGMEISEKQNSKIGNLQAVVLVLRAFDPFWYDTSTIVQTFKLNESTGLFFPILPLRLASSTVFADISIDNTGDVETWPEWIITGPGENIVLRNLSTGEVMSIDVSLETGETLTIDTRPYHKTVTHNDGSNLFYTLSDDSSLWSLREGKNSIQIEMANATTDSNIQLAYRNRYWGP
jgi:hypothetical protein